MDDKNETKVKRKDESCFLSLERNPLTVKKVDEVALLNRKIEIRGKAIMKMLATCLSYFFSLKVFVFYFIFIL